MGIIWQFNTVKESEELINWIKTIGFDTPEKCKYIYTKLIEKYEMENILEIF